MFERNALANARLSMSPLSPTPLPQGERGCKLPSVECIALSRRCEPHQLGMYYAFVGARSLSRQRVPLSHERRGLQASVRGTPVSPSPQPSPARGEGLQASIPGMHRVVAAVRTAPAAKVLRLCRRSGLVTTAPLSPTLSRKGRGAASFRTWNVSCCRGNADLISRKCTAPSSALEAFRDSPPLSPTPLPRGERGCKLSSVRCIALSRRCVSHPLGMYCAVVGARALSRQ